MKNGNKMTVNYKEKELRERIMKYYVYLSKSKINMLYEQIDNCVEIEHTKKGKITTGVFAGDVSSTEKKATTLSQRLDKIIENANDFGDISFDNEYATNKLSMTWTHINSDDITYWTGIIDDESITTKLLLIGSAHNIIGNNEEKCKGYSYSLGNNYLRGAILGHGDVNIARAMGALRKNGYDGWITVEFEGIEDNLLGIRISRNNLMKYMW